MTISPQRLATFTHFDAIMNIQLLGGNITVWCFSEVRGVKSIGTVRQKKMVRTVEIVFALAE